MRYLAFVLAVAFLAVAFLAGCGGDVTYDSPYKDGGASKVGANPVVKQLTDADANRLLDNRCTRCHSSGRWKKSTMKSTKEWEDRIDLCIHEGAMLRPVEKDPLVRYMKANFGK